MNVSKIALAAGAAFTLFAATAHAAPTRGDVEAIVELTAADPPDVLREWRRGTARFAARLVSMTQRPDGAPPC